MNPKDLVGAKKAPMDLVPPAGAIMSAPAHQNGADKYGAFNWRNQPVQLMTYLAAIRRHLDAFMDGQDLAEDTGIHHLSHMLAGMNIIADAMGMGNLIDNRPVKGPAADMLREQDKSVVTVEGHKTYRGGSALTLPRDERLCSAESCDLDHDPISILPPQFKTREHRGFLCGHKWGDEPITSGPALCGTAIHWSPIDGVERYAPEDDGVNPS